MKKILTLTMALACMNTQAQFQNGGFEDLTAQGLPSYWVGNLVLLGVYIDSLGNTYMDTVIYDDATSNYLLNTTDVHSGSNAAELRNAYNTTQNVPIPATWSAAADTTTYLGFPVTTFGMPQRPYALDFFAKYSPLSTDSGSVFVEVSDSSFNVIGGGSLAFSGTGGVYAPFHVPITYTSPDQVGFMQLQFSTATPTGTATLGTRLLIDDVSLDFSATGMGEMEPDQDIALFPNPATEAFAIRNKTNAVIRNVEVRDASGRSVASSNTASEGISVQHLAPGLYNVAITGDAGTVRRSVVVAR